MTPEPLRALILQHEDPTPPGHVTEWLAEHVRQREATEEHQHLKLNFNAAGVLEVICVGVDRVS